MTERHFETGTTVSTRIQQTFETLKSNGQMAFMPFVTAGDPDMTGTQKLISTLAATGVNLIEVGFPYSDPIADGPVIQSSYTRALNKKLTVHQIFDAVSELPTDELPPLVAMVSYAIIFRIGPKAFVESARDAGFSGFIIPDLPGDEAEEMFGVVREAGLDLIQLVAPTTPRERVWEILKACSGFVYCIAVAGTTGTRENLQTDLLDQLAWLRAETSLPLAVGFGISKPEHVDPLRNLADGVIVGSGIVRHLNEIGEGPEALDTALEAISTFSTSMVQATKPS